LTIIVYEMECQPISGAAARNIVVNGVPRQSPPGQTLLGLLRELQLEPSRVAVEMDRRIVRRAEWDTLELPPGARIEIVQFVGGG
jgi:sulfur carrier protein